MSIEVVGEIPKRVRVSKFDHTLQTVAAHLAKHPEKHVKVTDEPSGFPARFRALKKAGFYADIFIKVHGNVIYFTTQE